MCGLKIWFSVIRWVSKIFERRTTSTVKCKTFTPIYPYILTHFPNFLVFDKVKSSSNKVFSTTLKQGIFYHKQGKTWQGEIYHKQGEIYHMILTRYIWSATHKFTHTTNHETFSLRKIHNFTISYFYPSLLFKKIHLYEKKKKNMKRKRPEDMTSSTSSKTQKMEKKMNLIVVGSGGREHVLTW